MDDINDLKLSAQASSYFEQLKSFDDMNDYRVMSTNSRCYEML